MSNISFAGVVGVLTSRFWLMKRTGGWQRMVDKWLSIAMSVGYSLKRGRRLQCFGDAAFC